MHEVLNFERYSNLLKGYEGTAMEDKIRNDDEDDKWKFFTVTWVDVTALC